MADRLFLHTSTACIRNLQLDFWQQRCGPTLPISPWLVPTVLSMGIVQAPPTRISGPCFVLLSGGTLVSWRTEKRAGGLAADGPGGMGVAINMGAALTLDLGPDQWWNLAWFEVGGIVPWLDRLSLQNWAWPSRPSKGKRWQYQGAKIGDLGIMRIGGRDLCDQDLAYFMCKIHGCCIQECRGQVTSAKCLACRNTLGTSPPPLAIFFPAWPGMVRSSFIIVADDATPGSVLKIPSSIPLKDATR